MPESGENVEWIKAEASGTGNCVEVAGGKNTRRILIRDSKHPDGPRLEFTQKEWECFLIGVKTGDFDSISTL